MPLIRFASHAPADHGALFIAGNATLTGQVTLGQGSSIWFGAVLRGDCGAIIVGDGTNVQDNAVLHTGTGGRLTLGKQVSVGHCAVLHGCTVGDGCLIGMHATVLDGAVIGAGSLIAAGALVPAGMQVPPGSLVIGAPGRVRGPVSAEQCRHLAENAATYQRLAAQYAAP